MAQSSITLTASMRSNLLSLKSIQKQMDTTQERLSTGKKVNSAIDNASSYYQARALTNRAADLDSLLDSMGQGIQTIQAANEGIEAVTSYVEQLKSIANSAFALDPTSTSYTASMDSYKEQFDTIITEMGKLVKDSSYQGINLLTGGELTITFNESRTNRFTIKGDDVMEEMNLTKAADWASETTEDMVTKTLNVEDAEGLEVTTKVKQDVVVTAGAEILEDDNNVKMVLADGKYYNATTGQEVTPTGTPAAVDPAETLANDLKIGEKLVDGPEVLIKNGATIYNIDGTEAVKYGDQYYNAESGELVDTTDKEITEATGLAVSFAKSIDATLDELSAAIDYLRSYATELGNNFSIIETRQDFTEALVDVLETGSDNLVLADMNEESANYLALQTRQQLAVNSLSLASQSAQSVLSLF